MNVYEAIARVSDSVLSYLGDGEDPIFDTFHRDLTDNELAMIHVATFIMDTLELSKIDLPEVLKKIQRDRLAEEESNGSGAET